MDEAIPIVISAGWSAGVNAYMTVFLLGLFGRLGLGDVPDGLEDTWVMVAAGGFSALASHGVKAGLRMAINLSPDPVTTATASVTEDLCVGLVIALVVTHPWAALAVSMTFLAIGLTLISYLWRRIRASRARSAGSSARRT